MISLAQIDFRSPMYLNINSTIMAPWVSWLNLGCSLTTNWLFLSRESRHVKI